MKPLPAPNWNAKPNAQYRIPHKHVSNTHSMRTLTVSRVRAKPASRNMKPACMKNTRNAVTNTHIVLIGLTYGGFGGVASGAGAAGATGAAGVVAVAGAGVCACALLAELLR